jgi:hypothetical protein
VIGVPVTIEPWTPLRRQFPERGWQAGRVVRPAATVLRMLREHDEKAAAAAAVPAGG